MSFLTNLIKWKVPRLSTVNGNTVLVGAGATYPLLLGVTTISSNANQAIDASGDTTIVYQVERIDTLGAYDPAANTKITIPAGVSYVEFCVGLDFLILSNGEITCKLFKNGVYDSQLWQDTTVASQLVETTTSLIKPVTAGDYFEIVMQNNVASPQFMVSGASNNATFFQAKFYGISS